MIWFGIAFVVALLIGIHEAKDVDLSYGFVAFMCSGMIAGAAALFLSLLVGLNVYEPATHSYSFDVVAAQDGSSVEGRWSIFGGFINEESYYFFYREGSDGGIIQGKVLAANTRIYEDQETRNFIEVTKCNSFLGFWGMSDGCDPTYEIHVPEGSVKRDVEFDLE